MVSRLKNISVDRRIVFLIFWTKEKRFFLPEINVAPLVIQMTRRFSQMLMAFLFPKSQQQQQHEISNANKSTTKHPTTTAHKRRTRSAEVRERNRNPIVCRLLHTSLE